ncbi:Pkinase-domain-containing protein [Obba rivulosa]|uniref:non-specific serine/threonine protein kinase n=1 Tax=Obba rivulosa TaxID=1052685 RepID=A0A8E2DFF4_9APHY|nr:Pkinase-domain-containing protein [Obba rivulosa]
MASTTMPNFVGYRMELHGRRYELQKTLGEGTYGVVYRALDLASPVDAPEYRAVKIVRKHVPSERPGTYPLLKREMELHRSVSDHPNILTLHQVIKSDEYVFFILDFCPGGDLYTQIAKNRVFLGNDELVKKVFVQVLDAVHYCHQQGVFHRDLKPDNILCNKDGSEVYLADFGLATDRKRSVRHGCGTAFYISPECVGKHYEYAPYSTVHSDIWSLGVILINMIADCNPWHYPTAEDPSFQEFLHDPFFFYRALPISPAAAAILDRMFDPNPAARISIPELREAIINVDGFFGNVNADGVKKVKSLPVQSSPRLSADSDESSLLDEDIAIEEVDLGTLGHYREVDAPVELAMPNLSDITNDSSTTSSGDDDLIIPELDITSAANSYASGVKSKAMGEALVTLSLRNTEKDEKTRRLPALRLFEKFNLAGVL